MSNINNLRMSAATITFGGVSLGHTQGGVTFSYEPSTEDLLADQYGETPIDKVLTGETLTIQANLAEAVVGVLNSAMPAGAHALGGAGERLGMGTDAGYSLRADSKQLVLHPVDKAIGDTSEDVVIYKAVVADTVELNYEVDGQRVFEVTFAALVDETYASGRRLGHIGSTNVS